MSNQVQTIEIEQSLPQERLDVFLRTRLPSVSRGTIQRLIEEGRLQVNGAKTKPTHAPRLGEIITIDWPEPKDSIAVPQAIPLDVLFEDGDLIVVNKQAGLAVHPSAGHDDHTLVNALLHHCDGSLSGIGGVARPGIVHRLDMDTSGCLVAAKNDPAHAFLSKQFAERTVEKTYTAIACGEFARPEGRIHAAISRHPSHRKRMAVTEEAGREALTTYRVTEVFRGATLVTASIHTGRTHQIRVHFQHIGHPIVGDQVYGKRQNARLEVERGITAPRQMLHARDLSFVHPVTRERMQFRAPEPEDFLATLEALRGNQTKPSSNSL